MDTKSLTSSSRDPQSTVRAAVRLLKASVTLLCSHTFHVGRRSRKWSTSSQENVPLSIAFTSSKTHARFCSLVVPAAPPAEVSMSKTRVEVYRELVEIIFTRLGLSIIDIPSEGNVTVYDSDCNLMYDQDYDVEPDRVAQIEEDHAES